MLSQSRKKILCQCAIFICSSTNFFSQLCLCFWPCWVRLNPILPVNDKITRDSGIMIGLWRQCIRYLPDKYECFDKLNLPIPAKPEEDEVLYSINTMRWLVMASMILSGVANLFSMIGYECIALAGDNYKLRRRFLRLSGFLIFLSGLAGLIALSIFASGVFVEVFENLQEKLATMNMRLEKAEFDAVYNPIVYIGWLSSALGVFSGIGLCCLAASMYEQYDRSNNKQFKQRKYPYEYELEQQKYQQQAAAAAAAHQQQQNYNDYENEPVMSSFDKINQITTLDHHGNKKMEHIRKQAQRAALQQQKNNRIVAPSTSTDFPLPPNAASNQNQTRKHIPNGKLKKMKETTKKEPTAPTVNSLDTDDELGEMKLISDQESRDSDKDLSFTLPKPMNLKKESVTTDCEIETSLALVPGSSIDSSHLVHKTAAASDLNKTKRGDYAMEGYV